MICPHCQQNFGAGARRHIASCKSPAERAAVRAEVQRLQADSVHRSAHALIFEAFKVLPADRRPPVLQCQPSKFPWLGLTARKGPGKATVQRRQRPQRTQRSTACPESFSGSNVQRPTLKVHSVPVAPELTLLEAVQFLVTTIVREVERQLAPSLDKALAKSVATSAVKLAEARQPAPADLAPAQMTDDQLRIAIIKARANGDIARWQKLIAVLRKRSEAANALTHSTLEE